MGGPITLALICTLVVTSAAARISDNANVDGEGGLPYPGELSLVIWDRTREASYTLDLGVRIDEFNVQGQADAGNQRFWRLSNAADPALAKLRALGSATNSLQWAILGIDADGFAEPGDFNVYATLQQGPGNGVLNPNYSAMRGITNDSFNFAVGLVQNNLIASLNGDSANNPDNTHGKGSTLANGSSFTAKGQAGYFGVESVQLNTLGPSANTSIINDIGKSSWFYHLFASSYEPFDAIAVDEFDNLSADGYWGLAEDPADGALVLSYSLEPLGLSSAQQSFAAGIGRTEFSGAFSTLALEGSAVADAEASFGALPSLAQGAATLSPVPEPAGLGLWAGGLIGLAVASLRRQRR